ncbi:hypothetical protein [Mangrovimonas futianensis]|uniref:hypothetical protein n=1 Tax=Mangrovimonas futianensis TaxID=2895523 RepID=UPI001E5F8C75|nr:hypothetical protein [Mangrovimonas futianensis]MCF1421398.1 hypothetical protein [Mangrovimonas futianensis]
MTTRKYFHCYATANDSRLYLKDLRNLNRIKNMDSGVDKVFLFIGISKVHNVNFFDKIFVCIIKVMFMNHHSIELKQIFYKSNLGRDFSSYQMMLEKIKPISTENDYIFFQNRSGYGPFRKNWYKKFIEQFEKFESIAISGSTINFTDHPSRSLRNDLPHVQTYSFISKMYFLKMLDNEFPGVKEKIKRHIITNGEIELSQFFLKKGYKITCIEWPDIAITSQTPTLCNSDIKKNVKSEHYFYHRTYFKKENA